MSSRVHFCKDELSSRPFVCKYVCLAYFSKKMDSLHEASMSKCTKNFPFLEKNTAAPIYFYFWRKWHRGHDAIVGKPQPLSRLRLNQVDTILAQKFLKIMGTVGWLTSVCVNQVLFFYLASTPWGIVSWINHDVNLKLTDKIELKETITAKN